MASFHKGMAARYDQHCREGRERELWNEMNDVEFETDRGETMSFSFYDDPNPESWIYRRRMQEFAAGRAGFKRLREHEKLHGSREDSDYFHTVHSSVYDLSGRKLYLRIQEQDQVYEASVPADQSKRGTN